MPTGSVALRVTASGTADSSGCTITFGAVPLTRVWGGSIVIPLSPAATAWTITVGGFPWGVMTGPGPYNVQALPGEQVKAVATSGVTSGDVYTASLIGSDDPREGAAFLFPFSPSGVSSSGSPLASTGVTAVLSACGRGSGTTITLSGLSAGDTIYLALRSTGGYSTPSGATFVLIGNDTNASSSATYIGLYACTVKSSDLTSGSLTITLSLTAYWAATTLTGMSTTVTGTAVTTTGTASSGALYFAESPSIAAGAITVAAVGASLETTPLIPYVTASGPVYITQAVSESALPSVVLIIGFNNGSAAATISTAFLAYASSTYWAGVQAEIAPAT